MINKYSWEDTGKFIKVYVTDLPGIKDLAEDKIDMNFTEHSFELQIRGLSGVGNVRLAIPELFSSISLQGSKLKKKSSSVTIQMRKGDFDKKWSGLKPGAASGPAPDMGGMPPGGMFGGGAPPGAAAAAAAGAGAGAGAEGGAQNEEMMKMMMDMYEKGDDKMKKTIEEGMMNAMGGKAPGE